MDKGHPAKDKKGKTLSARKPTEKDAHNAAGAPYDARLRLWLERDRPDRASKVDE